MPSGLKTIGEYAFSMCSNLNSFELPETLERIGKDAFFHTGWMEAQTDDWKICDGVLLAYDGSGILRVGLGCAVLHECGHALAYRLLWQRWPEIEVSPFGLCLRLRGLPMTNLQELLLAAAGPAVNLLACAAVLAFMRATASPRCRYTTTTGPPR